VQCCVDNEKKKLPIHCISRGAINYQELLKSSSDNEIKRIDELQLTISPDSACNIQFSSGTTGKPKAAVVSHFSAINNGYHIGIRQGLDKKNHRICVNNPLFHAYGVVIAITNALNHASTLVFPEKHFTPEKSLKTIIDEKCDVIYGTPTSKLLPQIQFYSILIKLNF
jgi:medium-chain acyl-CoA ligase, mitochondrial